MVATVFEDAPQHTSGELMGITMSEIRSKSSTHTNVAVAIKGVVNMHHPEAHLFTRKLTAPLRTTHGQEIRLLYSTSHELSTVYLNGQAKVSTVHGMSWGTAEPHTTAAAQATEATGSGLSTPVAHALNLEAGRLNAATALAGNAWLDIASASQAAPQETPSASASGEAVGGAAKKARFTVDWGNSAEQAPPVAPATPHTTTDKTPRGLGSRSNPTKNQRERGKAKMSAPQTTPSGDSPSDAKKSKSGKKAK